MATTVDPIVLGAYFVDGDDVLIRHMGRVMQAWDYDQAEPDPDGEQEQAASVSGHVVFGGPPEPDVGDDIATWYVNTDVEVIDVSELVEMRLAKEADEAARPVLSLGAQGELVESPVVVADGSTVLAAEDVLGAESLLRANGFDPSDDPSLAYRRARGVVKGDEPAEDIIRRLRDGGDVLPLGAGVVEPGLVDQLAMRRRTLARFCRDYAKAWEDGEDTDLLGMLESNLQVAVRRVLELTDP